MWPVANFGARRACLCAFVPLCLPVCLSACLSVCLPACLPACLSVCLSGWLPGCPAACFCLFLPVSACLCSSLILWKLLIAADGLPPAVRDALDAGWALGEDKCFSYHRGASGSA